MSDAKRLNALCPVLASCVCAGKKTDGWRGAAAKTADIFAAVTAFVSTQEGPETKFTMRLLSARLADLKANSTLRGVAQCAPRLCQENLFVSPLLPMVTASAASVSILVTATGEIEIPLPPCGYQ